MMFYGEGKMTLENKLNNEYICFRKDVIDFHKQYNRNIKIFDEYGCKECDGYNNKCIKYEPYIPIINFKR